MNVVFYLSAAIAIASTVMVITRTNAMHALLYLVVSFLAVSLIFFALGAPFIAALEVIVYAGAIMVLFIFAIMLLNIGPQTVELEQRRLRSSGWGGPVALSLILLAELVYVLATRGQAISTAPAALIDPRQVGAELYTTYLIGVELASTLLLSALIGAYHLGHARRELDRSRRERTVLFKEDAAQAGEVETVPGELEAEKER